MANKGLRSIIFYVLLLCPVNLLMAEQVPDLAGKYHISHEQELWNWHQREITFSTEQPFTASHLISTVWFQPIDDPLAWSSLILIFYSDGIFGYGNYENGQYVKGKYRYVGEEVILSDFLFIYGTEDQLVAPFVVSIGAKLQ